MKSTINVEHKSIQIQTNFIEFTYNIEHSLGIINPGALRDLQGDPASLAGFLEHLGGEEELILFAILEHGRSMKKEDCINARQYHIGNPAIALQMTEQNIRCGLYTPLRLLVHENNKSEVFVEFDTPSSVFRQFNDSKIDNIAVSLEGKLLKLIKKSDTAIHPLKKKES